MSTSSKLDYLIETTDEIKNQLNEPILRKCVDKIKELKTGASTEEDWKPELDWWDIEKILEEDTEDYAHKAIFLLTDELDNQKSVFCYINGFSKYKLSDGQIIDATTVQNIYVDERTFDVERDKICSRGYKTRYIIAYSNKETQSLYVPHNVLYVILNNIISRSISLFYNKYFLQCVKFQNGAMISGNSLQTTFYNCFNLEKIEGLDCSNKTNINNAFYNCTKLKSITNLNLNKVIQCSGSFYNCIMLKDLGDIDFSEITELSSATFQNSGIIDLSRYTFGNIMNLYFGYMNYLKKLPEISTEFYEWSTGSLFYNNFSIEKINYKLKPAINVAIGTFLINLKEVKYIDCINLTNTRSIILFSNSYLLIEIGEIYNIHTPLSFNSNSILNKPTLLRIINALVDLTDETSLTLTLGSINLAKLTDEEKAIATNKNWILA